MPRFEKVSDAYMVGLVLKRRFGGLPRSMLGNGGRDADGGRLTGGIRFVGKTST